MSILKPPRRVTRDSGEKPFLGRNWWDSNPQPLTTVTIRENSYTIFDCTNFIINNGNVSPISRCSTDDYNA